MQVNKGRFIAGAVCPQCKEVDKLKMHKEEGEDIRECVRCGYRDVQRFDQQKTEPTTRVNKSRSEREAEEQPVQIKFIP
ncbi:MAG: YheV family putative metal-binding protein [Porticoccaceae bacterium]|jgi:uncharacterized protein|nr:YheV family putative metal-binding protein [Porticoccaceae bacterium]